MFSDVIPAFAMSNMLRVGGDIFLPAFPFIRQYVEKYDIWSLYEIDDVPADENQLYLAAGIFVI